MGKRYRSYGDEPLVASGDDTINGENGWDYIFGGDGVTVASQQAFTDHVELTLSTGDIISVLGVGDVDDLSIFIAS